MAPALGYGFGLGRGQGYDGTDQNRGGRSGRGSGGSRIKYLAYSVTGSIALYSDALESLVNVATAIAALFAVRLSVQPADRNHPYGHHKIEYFSAVFAGTLILVAAGMILLEAWGRHPEPPRDRGAGAGPAAERACERDQCLVVFGPDPEGRALRSPAWSPMASIC